MNMIMDHLFVFFTPSKDYGIFYNSNKYLFEYLAEYGIIITKHGLLGGEYYISSTDICGNIYTEKESIFFDRITSDEFKRKMNLYSLVN